MSLRLQIFDDFLPFAADFRAEALKATFRDEVGPDGETYKNICVRPSEQFEGLLSERLGRPVKGGYNLLRVNYEGEVPNAAIHSDNTYDQFAGVLYLNLPEQCQGGTAFWRHKELGLTDFPSEQEVRAKGKSPIKVYKKIHSAYNDAAQWEQTGIAEMKFNRLACFPTKTFHSRWPFAGFGTTPADGRLIVAFFFNLA